MAFRIFAYAASQMYAYVLSQSSHHPLNHPLFNPLAKYSLLCLNSSHSNMKYIFINSLFIMYYYCHYYYLYFTILLPLSLFTTIYLFIYFPFNNVFYTFLCVWKCVCIKCFFFFFFFFFFCFLISHSRYFIDHLYSTISEWTFWSPPCKKGVFSVYSLAP